jgi:hypothetical protein
MLAAHQHEPVAVAIDINTAGQPAPENLPAA